MSILGAIAGGGLNLIGGILGNEANRREAKNNRNWQAEMSNTSHQRQVADLRAAGLNPILSAHTGASTPSGGAAQMDNVIGPAVSTALQVRQLKKDIDAAESQIQTNEAIQSAQAAAAGRDKATARQVETNTKLLESQRRAVEAESKLREKEAQFDFKTIEMRKVGDLVQQGLGAANSAKQLFLNPLFKDRLKPWQGKTKDGTIFDRGTGEILNKP